MSEASLSTSTDAWKVRRRIQVPQLGLEAECAAVQRVLEGVDGVLQVSVDVAKGRVTVDYLQTRTDYRSLQETLDAAGVHAARGRWARVRAAWFQNLDLNGRANAAAPAAPCCSRPPPGSQAPRGR